MIRRRLEPVIWNEKRVIAASHNAFSDSYFSVANVSWGFFTTAREADLLLISKKFYLIEIEAKISLADLKKDLSKPHRQVEWQDQRIAELYYSMPEELWEKVKHNPPIPESAGVVIVRQTCGAIKVRKAKRNPNARQLTAQEMLRLARLGAIKFWSEYRKNEIQKRDGKEN